MTERCDGGAVSCRSRTDAVTTANVTDATNRCLCAIDGMCCTRSRPTVHNTNELHSLDVAYPNKSTCTTAYMVKRLGTSSTTAHWCLTSQQDNIFTPPAAVFLSYRVIDSAPGSRAFSEAWFDGLELSPDNLHAEAREVYNLVPQYSERIDAFDSESLWYCICRNDW